VEEIRSELYRLCAPEWNGTLMDLGNLRKGASLERHLHRVARPHRFIFGANRLSYCSPEALRTCCMPPYPSSHKGCPPVRVTNLAPGHRVWAPIRSREPLPSDAPGEHGKISCSTIWDTGMLHPSRCLGQPAHQQGRLSKTGRIRTDMLLAEPILRDRPHTPG
jgi:hypothetical protein